MFVARVKSISRKKEMLARRAELWECGARKVLPEFRARANINFFFAEFFQLTRATNVIEKEGLLVKKM